MNIFFPPNQLEAFVSMTFIGFLLGVIYDSFKIKRELFGTTYLILIIDDFIFSFLFIVVFLFSVFIFNHGIFRWQQIFFCCVGFLIYRMTLSRLIMPFFRRVVLLIKLILKTLLRPLNLLYKLVCSYLNDILYKYIVNFRIMKFITGISP